MSDLNSNKTNNNSKTDLANDVNIVCNNTDDTIRSTSSDDTSEGGASIVDMAGDQEGTTEETVDITDSTDVDNVVNSVGPNDVINAIFNPMDEVCIRGFSDIKNNHLPGMKKHILARDFLAHYDALKEANKQGYCISFVVNSGGDTDESINHINAFFIDMDDAPFDVQMERINNFPLPPSIIIKTRKSYHSYWLVRDGSDVSLFRPIQKALIKHFNADPACVNESRCMRLPGFLHQKEAPVEVECVLFNPERRYSQQQLIDVLPEYESGADSTDAPSSDPMELASEKGLNAVVASCEFVWYCWNNAGVLSEPLWYAFITNLADFEGGRELIHSFSKRYPYYDVNETDAKIKHYFDSKTKPMLCETIEKLGFTCNKRNQGVCTCRCPADRRYVPLSVLELNQQLSNVPVSGDILTDTISAQIFITNYLYSAEKVAAETYIKECMRTHFKMRKSDMGSLVSLYRSLNKEYTKVLKKLEKRKDLGMDDIPLWYKETDKGYLFLQGVLANFCHDNFDIFYTGGEYYSYTNGAYLPITDDEHAKIIYSHLFPELATSKQVIDTQYLWRIQIGKKPKELNPNPYLICLKNGVYDVFSGKLIPHDPSYLMTTQLPVNFVPGSQCPRFLQYLNEVQTPDQIYLIQEIMGYLMIPITKGQVCFILVGKADAGKSLLIRVISEILLGEDNVSSISWQDFSERFRTANLFGKLCNAFADLPTKNIQDNGMFKALIGEDTVLGERKFKNEFPFKNTARPLFSANELPFNYGDRSDGFYRRLILIRFLKAVDKAKRDPDLFEKLSVEADGIFLFALEGLVRLINNRWRFSVSKTNEQELKDYKLYNNSALAFIEECCRIDVNASVSKGMLRMQYEAYCRSNGVKPFSDRNFKKDMLENHPSITEGHDTTGNTRIWVGIGFVSL